MNKMNDCKQNPIASGSFQHLVKTATKIKKCNVICEYFTNLITMVKKQILFQFQYPDYKKISIMPITITKYLETAPCLIKN
jgi:hypothetical protein